MCLLLPLKHSNKTSLLRSHQNIASFDCVKHEHSALIYLHEQAPGFPSPPPLLLIYSEFVQFRMWRRSVTSGQQHLELHVLHKLEDKQIPWSAFSRELCAAYLIAKQSHILSKDAKTFVLCTNRVYHVFPVQSSSSTLVSSYEYVSVLKFNVIPWLSSMAFPPPHSILSMSIW